MSDLTRQKDFQRQFFRRDLLCGMSTAGMVGAFHVRARLAAQAADIRKQGRSMILLYMQGAPSQLETFDPKPGTGNGGPTQSIGTAVAGIQIANGWEKTAKQMQDIAIIRSLTNKEGQHQRASYQLHTGYLPTGSVKHPSLGANIAKELSTPDGELPSVVTIGEGRGQGGNGNGAGFLGVDYEPFHISNAGQIPENVETTVDTKRFQRRLGLLDRLEGEFAGRGGESVVQSHRKITDKSSKLILTPLLKTFDLSDEPLGLKDKYGDTSFGKGCLLARRLIESGVTFVEVGLGGWDTHDENFERVGALAGECDPAISTLIADLKDRGMLDKTLIVWVGEFGRTPKINPRGGRDHWPRNFNALIAGGGIRGGQVIGETSKEGTTITKDPVSVPDLFNTICKSLHIRPDKENMSPIGRPLKIVDGGSPIEQLFA